MITYLLLLTLFYFYLKNNKSIKVTLTDSFILKNNETDKTVLFMLSLIFPFTVIYLLILKIKNVKKFIYLGFSLIALIYLTTLSISYYNQSVDIELSYKTNLNKRGVLFNTMRKETHEYFKLAKIVDTSYSKLVELVASSRKDGENLFWRWAQENNPNANYSEVSTLYYKLFDKIETLRGAVNASETLIQLSVNEWEKLHRTIPSRLFLFYQEPKLPYKPILSTEARITNQTGVDNNYNF